MVTGWPATAAAGARWPEAPFNGFPETDDELRYMRDMARDFGAPFRSVIGQRTTPC